jgi:ribonucleoside-diphosphate reductase alpha chain
LATDKKLGLSEQAEIVLNHRYFLRDEANEVIEDTEGLFQRVARAVAQIDELYGADEIEVDTRAEEFYDLMSSLKFLPNSPTLMNAGTPEGTLSACFVLPLEDSMEGIMKAATDTAMVQKFGGGTGFALSKIRARGENIATTHGISCGPIEVLKTLSRVSSMITQGGKRDGANMAVMSVYHPDILEFISCKASEGDIHNFNISVGVDSEFMRRVIANEYYELIHPHNGKVAETINAAYVFERMVQGAWENGEPGVVFLDRVNEDNHVAHIYGPITATNPCGEQPLLANESCNLGSLNLAAFTVGPNNSELDWTALETATRLGVRFLDNVIDANVYATPDIEKQTKATRKIGLGVMGFADLLYQMNVPYNSASARSLGERIMGEILMWADDESYILGEQRGLYPAADMFQPYRNSNRLTVAPTGTISMIADTSSGIEPTFALVWTKKNILEGKTLFYTNRYFLQAAHEGGFYSEELMEHLANGGTLGERSDVPEWAKAVFVTAMDISASDHIMMQASFQMHCDSGISKTINFPRHATIADVREAYLLAWQASCKGVTIYRAGSREKEVLQTGKRDSEEEISCCSDPHVVEESGCRTCKVCGWSACSVS